MSRRAPCPLDAALDPLPDAPLCVGLSGGLDSSVLLHVLARRCSAEARPLRALHVNHGLSACADAWTTACASMCAALGVAFVVRRVEVDRQAGLGLEGAARASRRHAFAETLEAGEALVLAHHQDDQAETFLLRALRGSGPDGLGAMHPWQRFARGSLWRPWLDQPRRHIEAYAHAHGLRWIEDDSNADVAFDRNFLRREVMPRLHARWPHASSAMATSALHCRDDAELLHAADGDVLETVRTHDPNTLSLPALRACTATRRARALRSWIASLGLPALPRAGARRIEADLMQARADGSAAFSWQGAVIEAWRDRLHARRVRSPLPADLDLGWTGEAPLELPDGGRLVLEGAPRFDTDLRVRARRGGERITLAGRAHSHALKHVLQNRDVPPWTRKHLPLAFDADGALLAAGDVVVGARLDAWLGLRHARIGWTPPT